MGYCRCFGTKTKDQQPSSPDVRISNKSSVKMNEKLEQTSDLLVPKDNDHNATTFFYRELATATNNFRQELLIGEGGFGLVYKGVLERTQQIVAVKQLNHSGSQGENEFLVEVLMLSLLRHPNLVNLIGYCAEGEQRLLVYEFMPGGSLEDRLHNLKPDMEPLDWDTRMKIAAGAAKGLDFLHNEADPPVIYRDLKTANILLDQGFHPKLSDFGLAKFGPPNDKSHVSTRVMGTEGYCAPEYAGTGKLTVKSDIYSFGVLLLEVITGRRPLDMACRDGKQALVDLARPMLKEPKKLASLADPVMGGKFPESSLCRAMEIALMCQREDANSRPSMKDVVNALDFLASRKCGTNADAATTTSPTARNENLAHRLGDDLEETRVSEKSDQDRQLAVAEAKMWGESCRDKMRQGLQNDDTEKLDR